MYTEKTTMQKHKQCRNTNSAENNYAETQTMQKTTTMQKHNVETQTVQKTTMQKHKQCRKQQLCRNTNGNYAEI